MILIEVSDNYMMVLCNDYSDDDVMGWWCDDNDVIVNWW